MAGAHTDDPCILEDQPNCQQDRAAQGIED